MKIAIIVSQITPGGGLSKYISTLADILTDGTPNKIWIIVTHFSEKNNELKELSKNRHIKYIYLGNLPLVRKYISLVASLRRLNPDLIINNYNAPTQYVLPFLKKKTKIVHVLHNNTDDFYRVASINARHVNRWIAPTPAIADYFNKYTEYKYRDRISVIPHGVHLPDNPPQKKHNRLQLIFVGVLYEHKGVKILPEIIKRLLDKKYDFLFTFVGDGILRKDLETALQDEITNNHVKFTGRISSKEVYQRLGQSDLLVYPTHVDAFGLVIAEAMMNRCVPVATHLEGITDSLIDDGINGYLIPQDHVDIFIARISLLIEDTNLRENMSAAAEEKAFNCFSLKTMRKNYTTLIKQLKNEIFNYYSNI